MGSNPHATQRNEWIAARLGGGHASFVTRAVRHFRENATSEVRRLKEEILEYLDRPEWY